MISKELKCIVSKITSYFNTVHSLAVSIKIVLEFHGYLLSTKKTNPQPFDGYARWLEIFTVDLKVSGSCLPPCIILDKCLLNKYTTFDSFYQHVDYILWYLNVALAKEMRKRNGPSVSQHVDVSGPSPGSLWCVWVQRLRPGSWWTSSQRGSCTGRTPLSRRATNSPSASSRCSPGKVGGHACFPTLVTSRSLPQACYLTLVTSLSAPHSLGKTTASRFFIRFDVITHTVILKITNYITELILKYINVFHLYST